MSHICQTMNVECNDVGDCAMILWGLEQKSAEAEERRRDFDRWWWSCHSARIGNDMTKYRQSNYYVSS